MAYKTYKKNYRRKRYVRKRRSAYSMAKKSLYLAKKAQGQKELKHTNHSFSDTVSMTGTIVSLSTTTEGDGNNAREGNVIYPTSSRIRMNMEMDVDAVNTLVRVIVFKWLVGGTTPIITDILQTNSINSFKSEANRFNSKILYDRVHQLNIGATTKKMVNINNKFRNYLMAFPEATAQANKNAIYILMLSDETVDLPTVSFQQRLYFKDA